MANHKTPNRLINQTSPYLLQHAYNPVNWFPWGEEALKRAKEEDKPIIVSIGYSSCHWCHVMERESFENDEVAKVMNDNFINIKVDREERPDIDQIYMDAVHAMNIRGGWPLNVILTPDAKPFYGGTYFPASHWVNLLNQISTAFREHRADLEKSAEDFTRVLNYTELQKYNLQSIEKEFTREDFNQMYLKLEKAFDKKWGGMDKEPKFPMPSIWQFLLRHHHITKDENSLRQVKLTLDKIAYGGIYDQIGGGFARYSTDGEWFAPHFEKMLYDNGQLLTLYSEAYALTKSELYKEVVHETVDFLERELTDPSGGFYSALDADSEGEEGKFYIWIDDEINSIAGEDAGLFKDYYNTQFNGNWEKDYNILNRTLSDQAFANKHKLDLDNLKEKVAIWKKNFLEARNKRIRPGLDDKILTSWNALMLHGLVSAYRNFGEDKFLSLALRNANFIKDQLTKDGKLMHSWKSGKASIDGYLEDYAFVIHAYIELYQANFDEAWLKEAERLASYVMDHFYDPLEEMFFFTSDLSEKLIARKKEVFDNVIPASNSAMALNLYKLGIYFENEKYSELSLKMLGRVKKLLLTEPSYLANWGILFTMQLKPTAEVVISGKDLFAYRQDLEKNFLPNVLLAGTTTKSNMPLLQGRTNENGSTMVYVCFDRTCKLPVKTVNEALKQLEE